MKSPKAILAAGVALVACPCHLPLTVPVLVALTGGSAVGLWLAHNQMLVWLAATGLFVGGLTLTIVWLTNENQTQCKIPSARPITSKPIPGSG